MSDTTTETIDWAWAVLDRVITPTQTGFRESHTVTIATVPDPRKADYLTSPEHLMNVSGDIYPDYPVREHGWETVSDFDYLATTVVKPVDTNTSFGILPHYRAAARIRRQGLAIPSGEAETVPYGNELAALFAPGHLPSFLGGDSEHPLLGSVSASLDLLGETAATGIRHCDQPWHTGPNAGDDPDCTHMFMARTTVDAFHGWFLEAVREHGWPIIGVDLLRVCHLAAEQAAAHPDAAFRAECLAIARQRAAEGTMDPDHLALLEASVVPAP
ncbi:hypothetical protein [Glycomyces sp. YM15]|uniref:hypothetical protein n=1 Tax=Glycomyces sp. YM15 TaxID=2800446 RepID=UPI001963F65F|nr:hypothetical protein [Glycomyces sp. YM15]